MADPRLERLIASLGAAFDASIAREEEAAASDLAFALSQDRRLTRAAAAVGPLEARLPDGAAVPVVRIGADYLAGGSSGSVLVPAAAAVAREVEQGRAPELRLDELLVQVLRRWAREASEIDVAAPGTWASGVLTRAASDHIELDGRRGRWVIGWGAIQWIRRVRGG